MAELNDWNVIDANNDSAPPDGWPENTMNYSEVNNTGRAVQGKLKRFFADVNGSLAAGGVVNAYTVTMNASYTAYFDGLHFVCSIPITNTGAVTLNVNSLGVKTVKTATGEALVGGELVAAGMYQFYYDGTDLRVLTGSKVFSSLTVSGTAAINDLDVTTNIDTATLAVTTSATVGGSDVVTVAGGQTIAGTTTLNDLNVTTNIDVATLVIATSATVGGSNVVTVAGGQTIAGTTTLNDLNVTTNIDTATLVTTGAATFGGTTTLNGALAGNSFKDEDNMASNSDTAVASQQSIKAYVDNALSAGFGAPTLALEATTSGTGTYTPSANVKRILVEIQGGGGGGGGADGTGMAANAGVAGGGGGAGAYVRAWLDGSNIPASMGYTVGAGGAGGSTAGGNGATGGQTDIRITNTLDRIAAYGGSGGTGDSTPSTGGAAGFGGNGGSFEIDSPWIRDFTYAGSCGVGGYIIGDNNVGTTMVQKGMGQPSFSYWPRSQVGFVAGNGAGIDGSSGSGGSGGVRTSAGTADGGNGGNGYIRVWEFF